MCSFFDLYFLSSRLFKFDCEIIILAKVSYVRYYGGQIGECFEYFYSNVVNRVNLGYNLAYI